MEFYLFRPGRGIAENASRKRGLPEWYVAHIFHLSSRVPHYSLISQRCELCPSREGALKRTNNGNWAHVICALYIPEVRFSNVASMEPIILAMVPQERYLKVRKLCSESMGLYILKVVLE